MSSHKLNSSSYPTYIYYDSDEEQQNCSSTLNDKLECSTYQQEEIIEDENDPSYSTTNSIKKSGNNDFELKIENISTVTLENVTPYIRRENFLQTYKAFMLFLDKLLITDINYILPRAYQTQQDGESQIHHPRGYNLKRIGIISDQLTASFSKRGIHFENDIYRYLLENSMNSPLLCQHGQQIFTQYLHDPEIQKAFEREYNYQKGKINYFDPDFFGTLEIIPQSADRSSSILFELRLNCFKDKLYLRVMMVMYKKLIRLVFILEMIFQRIFGKSGRHLFFDIIFTFKYAINQMNRMQMHNPRFFQLSANKKVEFVYRHQDEAQKEEQKSQISQ